MADPRYGAKVGGMDALVLPKKLQDAIGELQARFPGLGVALFVFDFGQGGGMSYISNAERDGMVKALREFIAKHDRRN